MEVILPPLLRRTDVVLWVELPLELLDFPLRRDFIKELLEVVISGSLLFWLFSARLYKRKRERTSYIREAVEIIRANNHELLNEATLYILNKSLSDKDHDEKHDKEFQY
jgi:hypothetical protein